MRLNEIDDADKSALRLKGTRYEFTDHLDIVTYAINIVGNSAYRRNLLKNDIDIYLNEITIFLNEQFPDNDPDVINAKDIYIKLIDIKNKL
jgi:hypothetical protein